MNRLSVIFCMLVLALTTSLFWINGCASNNGPSDSTSDPDPIPLLEPSINIFINQVETVCSIGVPEISAYVTVIDEQGDRIDGLNLTHFEITENESPNPTSSDHIQLSYIDEELAAPTSISIIMDYSGSMIEDTETKLAMENAVLEFIRLMKDGDQAEIIKFNTGIKYFQPLTDDKAVLEAAVTGQEVETGTTYLYDTLYTGIEDLIGISGRKAVVAITDGEEKHDDNYPGDGRTEQNVIALAQTNRVPLFILGLGRDISVESLLEMTEETSGHYYQAATSDELNDIYAKISNLFNEGQYLFTFDGTPDGSQTGTLSISVSYGGLSDSATAEFSYPDNCI